MDYDKETILRDYFRVLDDPTDDDLVDLSTTVDDLARDSPGEAWPLVRALIESAPSELAIDYLAAGPLEQLLICHGEQLAEIVAADAANDVRVQNALAYVIIEPTAVVRKHLGNWLRRSVV